MPWRISVTRRYVEFLFTREETVMSELERQFKEAIIGSWYANGRAKTVAHGADMAWEATKHLFEGDGDVCECRCS